MINGPTHFGTWKNSCIDQIITNSHHVLESGVADVNISDHQLVFFVKKKKKDIPTKSNFQGRSYRNYDSRKLFELLDIQNWELFFQNDDPDVLWDIMMNSINVALDQLCPKKIFKIKKYKEPWISQELLELIKDKDLMLKKAKKSKLPEDWIIAKRYRNDCLSKIRKAKSDFVTSELEFSKNDSKKFWKNIKEVLPIGSKSNKKIILFDEETSDEIQDTDIANYINDFFAHIGSKLAADFNTPWYFDGIENNDDYIENIIVTHDEVLKICREIDVNKSSCIENVSSKVMKDALIHLNRKFTHVMNNSLTKGIFPRKWKYAKVTPLFKGGNRNGVGNYRPVSLLPLPSKIIERIVHNRLSSFLEENNILDPNQGGFRKGHSTVNTISKLTNDIFEGINKGDLTTSCFIDMAKAFDTVNHVILCKKLAKLGIKGNIFKWIQNYLSDRKQCTFANGMVSSLLDITCGVPQGSILGPLFFIIYVNDMKHVLKTVII